MLQEKIIAIYCIVDDLLKERRHFFDPRAKITDSELVTIAISSGLFFCGNWLTTYNSFYSFGLIKAKVDKSRITRRIAALEPILEELISVAGHIFTEIRADKEFILDSAPIAICDNVRIPRAKLLIGEDFRGYVASFKRYFYGLRLQLITTKEGIPVSYTITEGKLSDAEALHLMPLKISAESKIYADAGYTDYNFEDNLKQQREIDLLVQRKKNTKREREKQIEKQIKQHRKRIETVFSQLKGLMKRKIHAVTIETFMIKIKCFILALQFNFFC